MPKHEGVFVPHRECTEASGGCFTAGRCLDRCRADAKRKQEKRILDLERRLLALETDMAKMKLTRKDDD